MIAYNPRLNGDGRRFFTSWAASQNIPTSSITINPVILNGDFGFAGANNSTFDLSKIYSSIATQPYTGTEVYRNLFFGSLFLKIYTTVPGPNTYTFWLMSGRSGAPANYLVDQRTGVGMDGADLGKAREFQYESIGFNLLHMNVDALGSVNTEFMFQGLMISF